MSTSHGINDFLFLSAFLTIAGKKIKHPYQANISLHLTLRDPGVSILPVHWKINKTSERAVDPKELSNLPYPCTPAARKKHECNLQGTSTRLSVDFSAEILQIRGEWNDIFKVLKMSIFSQEYFIWKVYLNIWKTKGFLGSWPHHYITNRWGNNGNSDRHFFYFLGLQNHCRWWLQPWD